jgi:hypothetical protein
LSGSRKALSGFEQGSSICSWSFFSFLGQRESHGRLHTQGDPLIINKIHTSTTVETLCIFKCCWFEPNQFFRLRTPPHCPCVVFRPFLRISDLLVLRSQMRLGAVCQRVWITSASTTCYWAIAI